MMASIFGWLRRKGGSRTSGKRPKEAAPAPTRQQKELFREAETRPVDLAGNVETKVVSGAQVNELVTVIRTELGTTRDPGTRELLHAMEQSLERGDIELPPLPESILRVQRLLASSEFEMSELGDAIRLDPALATKIVGIANSAFYGAAQPIHAVEDAMVRIGVRETRNIVFAISMHSKVFRAPGYDDVIRVLFEHSLRTSLAAQRIAAELGEDPDLGFIGGLIHDVGRAVILGFAGDVRRRTRGRSVPDAGELHRVQGLFHAPLGALVADSWNLAPELGEAIALHHAPDSGFVIDRLTRAITVADLLAWRLAETDPEAPAADELIEALQKAGIESETTLEIAAEVDEAFASLSRSI